MAIACEHTAVAAGALVALARPIDNASAETGRAT